LSDIFISYASADRDKARRIARIFEERGHSVWWDRTIPPGREFDEVIQEAIAAAKCAVVLWSKTSVKSKWVKTEAAEAESRDVLVPVRIDETPLPLEFKRIQTADLSSWNGERHHPELANLIGSVEQLVRGEAPPPRMREPPEEHRRSTRFVAPVIGFLLVAVGGWAAYHYVAVGDKQEAKPTASLVSGSDKVASEPNPPAADRTDTSPARSVAPAPPAPAPEAPPEKRDSAALVSQTDFGKGRKRINLLAAENGGQVLVASSDAWAKMVDGDENQYVYIGSGEGVYAFKDEQPAVFDMFTVLIKETNEFNLNEFELLSGNDSPLGRFDSIGKFKTQNGKLFKTPFQEFAFPAVRARYLKVRSLTNHQNERGGAHGYEFRLLGYPE
jgi:hypothetical protein